MRWYDRLYVGEKAKKSRYEIIQSIRNGKLSGHYVLTPSLSGKNLLDLYPAFTLLQPYYKKQDLLVVGIAADYEDAVRLSGRIVAEVYKKTGGFDVSGFLFKGSGGQNL